MAVPKKKKSYLHCRIKYNNWKVKKLSFNPLFTVCHFCTSLTKVKFACNNCSQFFIC